MEPRKLRKLLGILKEAGVSSYVYNDDKGQISIVFHSHNLEDMLPESENVPQDNDDLLRAELWSSS